MKRKLCLLLLLSVSLLPLSARAYVGLHQGPVASGLEIGYMTRSFEQNLSLSLPLCYGALTLPMASGNLLWRIQRFNPLVIGLGVGIRVGWGDGDGYLLALGGVCSLSWEVLGKGEVLFAEGAYMPFLTEEGAPLSSLAKRQAGQYLRIGWRHLF